MNTPPNSPTSEELERVVAYLQEQHRGPGLTKFELSIASQFAKEKWLSRKQVDAILNKADRSHYPGPKVVPAGHYAVQDPDGTWEFVKVWRGTNDPTFVRVYRLASKMSDDHGEELNTKTYLARIVAVSPAIAATNYGRLTTKCSQCRRRLTNALSRKLNIGPVCGGRFYEGDSWNYIKLEASMWLVRHGINPNEDLPDDVDLTALEEAERV